MIYGARGVLLNQNGADICYLRHPKCSRAGVRPTQLFAQTVVAPRSEALVPAPLAFSRQDQPGDFLPVVVEDDYAAVLFRQGVHDAHEIRFGDLQGEPVEPR